jgi:competence protein ComEA
MNKSYWWLVSYLVISVVLVAGLLNLIAQPPRGDPIQLIGPPTPAPLVVFVSGAVNSPGLVSLPPGSRVNDAIQAAGGFRNEADTASINLAMLLEDGAQVNVPSLGTPSANGEVTRANPSATFVDINSAALEQLDTLPEIGPKTAQAIIDYRNANGPFETIDEIIEVDGVGQVTFDKIKHLITVGSSTP